MLFVTTTDLKHPRFVMQKQQAQLLPQLLSAFLQKLDCNLSLSSQKLQKSIHLSLFI